MPPTISHIIINKLTCLIKPEKLTMFLKMEKIDCIKIQNKPDIVQYRPVNWHFLYFYEIRIQTLEKMYISHAQTCTQFTLTKYKTN